MSVHLKTIKSVLKNILLKISPTFRKVDRMEIIINKIERQINNLNISKQLKNETEHRTNIVPVESSDDITKKIGDAWIVEQNRNKYANSYYDDAEECINIFWSEDTVFYKCFSQLDCSNIVELACGHGRHVVKYLDKANHISLVDINEQNINFCKNRFSNEKKIDYFVNDGNNFREIKTNSQTSIFTYDAMVHFEMLDILSYIKEANRILITGGKILFHHSNADYKPELGWDKDGGRNFMSADIFAYLAIRHGFIVLSQDIFPWGSTKVSDCLSLCKKVKDI